MVRAASFLAVGLVATALLLASCSNASDPGHGTKLNPQNLGAISTDSTAVSAYLMFAGSALHQPGSLTPDISTLANAYFTNSSGWVSPSSVSINSQSLSALSTGSFSHGNPTAPSSPYTLNWSAVGYLGSTLSLTQTLPSPMSYSTFTSGDTISKSIGATIAYSGNDGGMLFGHILVHGSLNAYLISPDSVPALLPRTFAQTDNGSASITPAILSSLTPNRWYWLKLSHYTYKRETYQGEQVGMDASFDVSAYFYLKP